MECLYDGFRLRPVGEKNGSKKACHPEILLYSANLAEKLKVYRDGNF